MFVLASLWALYPLAGQLVDERVAKLSCVLLCFSPFHLYFGHEARMYSMLGFLTILSSLLFLRCLSNPSRRAIVGYTLVAVLGAYTHLYLLFAVAAHFIYLAVRHRSQAALFRRVFAAQAVAGVSYLPWGILMVSHGTSEPWWKGPDLIVLRRGFIASPFLRNYRPPPGQRIRKSEEVPLDSLRAARRLRLVLAHAPDADAYTNQIAPTHPIEKTWLFPRSIWHSGCLAGSSPRSRVPSLTHATEAV